MKKFFKNNILYFQEHGEFIFFQRQNSDSKEKEKTKSWVPLGSGSTYRESWHYVKTALFNRTIL